MPDHEMQPAKTQPAKMFMERGVTQPLFKAALATVLLSAACVAPALAQRVVIVNGQWMSPAQIDDLERAHCGFIPDGNYVLDFATGVWSAPGGGSERGNIADNCGSRAISQSARSAGEGKMSSGD